MLLADRGGAASRGSRRAGLAPTSAASCASIATLRSVSHPYVFAVGDCAGLATADAEVGRHAVRQGEVLEREPAPRRRRARRSCDYQPQPRALSILSCGARYAIAARGGWSARRALGLVVEGLDRPALDEEPARRTARASGSASTPPGFCRRPRRPSRPAGCGRCRRSTKMPPLCLGLSSFSFTVHSVAQRVARLHRGDEAAGVLEVGDRGAGEIHPDRRRDERGGERPVQDARAEDAISSRIPRRRAAD